MCPDPAAGKGGTQPYIALLPCSALQAVTQAQNELAVAVINAETLVQRQTVQASLLVSQAIVTAASLELANTQAIQSIIARYTAQRESYLSLKESLGLTSSQLLRLVSLDAQLDRQKNVNTTSTMVRMGVPTELRHVF
jgi:hypothetical protein